MHSPQMKMTENDFMESSETMISFVEDLGRKWQSNGDFEMTTTRLKKVSVFSYSGFLHVCYVL